MDTKTENSFDYLEKTDLFKSLTNNDNLKKERALAFVKKMRRNARERMSELVNAIENKKDALSVLKDFGVDTTVALKFDMGKAEGAFEDIANLEYKVAIDELKMTSYKKSYEAIFNEGYNE